MNTDFYYVTADLARTCLVEEVKRAMLHNPEKTGRAARVLVYRYLNNNHFSFWTAEVLQNNFNEIIEEPELRELIFNIHAKFFTRWSLYVFEHFASTNAGQTASIASCMASLVANHLAPKGKPELCHLPDEIYGVISGDQTTLSKWLDHNRWFFAYAVIMFMVDVADALSDHITIVPPAPVEGD